MKLIDKKTTAKENSNQIWRYFMEKMYKIIIKKAKEDDWYQLQLVHLEWLPKAW